MKTIKSLLKLFMIITFSGSVILFLNRCEKPDVDEFNIDQSVLLEGEIPLKVLLNHLDLKSNILFVQKGESIQDVVDSAIPGDVIYIEPGNYQKSVSIPNTDIKVIGFSLEPDDLTIKNAENSNIEIIKLYDRSSLDNLQNNSVNRGKGNILQLMNRTDLGGGIAHYQFEITMGTGEYDVVTIHRVVKENRAYKPIRTKGHVFMVHGAIQNFDDVFLTAGAETINAQTSSPYYLASNKIDVWGIDMGWTSVPVENEDYSFMDGWGMEKDIDHALTAMSITRLIRGLTRQGFSRMNLLGFSYGVHVAYGAASRETQQHWFWRDVKGIIPVDSMFKTDNAEVQANACGEADYLDGLINSGQYNDPWGVGLISMGNLAVSDPDGISPFHGAFTNSQFLIWVGSQGFFTADASGAYVYSDPSRFIRMAVNLSPHWPMQVVYDFTATKCPSLDVSHDDHLTEVSVPILYIGAGEGSEVGAYSGTLTASTDVEQLIIPGYSHADLWFAYEADNMVWSPLRDWIINHK